MKGTFIHFFKSFSRQIELFANHQALVRTNFKIAHVQQTMCFPVAGRGPLDHLYTCPSQLMWAWCPRLPSFRVTCVLQAFVVERFKAECGTLMKLRTRLRSVVNIALLRKSHESDRSPENKTPILHCLYCFFLSLSLSLPLFYLFRPVIYSNPCIRFAVFSFITFFSLFGSIRAETEMVMFLLVPWPGWNALVTRTKAQRIAVQWKRGSRIQRGKNAGRARGRRIPTVQYPGIP